MNRIIGLTVICLVLLSFAQSPKPTIYLIGDSTVRNSNTQYWGWGTFLETYLDTNEVRVANHAMAGRSTRTFRKEGRWNRVDSLFRHGDYLLIQFGHNEGSKPDTSKNGYRGVLRGIGKDSVVLDWGDGKSETVRTYGENLRQFIIEAKAKGVTPVLLSMIPRNQWNKEGKVKRANEDFGLWAKQIAEEQGVAFVDLNSITADKYDLLGATEVKEKYFPGDHTHTNDAGAKENAASVIEGLKRIKHPIAKFIK